MSRWTNTARNLQRAVPLGVINGVTTSSSSTSGDQSSCSSSTTTTTAAAASSSSPTVDASNNATPSFHPQYHHNKSLAPPHQLPYAFSPSEIHSLKEDLRSTSDFLPEEKRQLLEGLFDLAHDPILQHQVLNNPAFGRILTAATKLPMSVTEERFRVEPSRNNGNKSGDSVAQNLRGSMSGGFPEVQGTLIFDTTQSSAGWSVMIRASLPSVPSNPSCNGECSTATDLPQGNQCRHNEYIPTSNEVCAHSETLFQRVFAYVSSLWHWLWPDYHNKSKEPNYASMNPPSTGNPSGVSSATSPDKVNRIKMWSILGTTMIMLALVLRRAYVHFHVAEQHSRELGRLLIMATLDHVFAFDCKHL